MSKSLIKELYWILGTILLTLTIGVLSLGSKLFNGQLLDLQLHDTYFIIPKMLLMSGIFIFLLMNAYINRRIWNRLNNRLLGSSMVIILTLFLIVLVNYWNWVYGYANDSGYYVFDKYIRTEKISEFTMLHWLLPIVIVATFITIVTTGLKIIKPRHK